MSETRHLRPRDGNEQRATSLELFFDLVFVFAITQISHYLIKHLNPEGVAQATLLLLVTWWAWNYTTWMTNIFDPEQSKPVRIVLIGVMGLTLIMSIAIPYAFTSRSLMFAGAYVALQVLRNAFTVWGVPSGTEAHRSNLRIFWWSVGAGALWIAGAVVDRSLLVPLWCAALLVDYLGPVVRYWTPGLGQTGISDWAVDGGHFAERFQLLIIIALGEGIVVTGATAGSGELSGLSVMGIVIAFLTSAAMWWLYFNFVAERARQRLQSSDQPGKLARNSFTYLHLPIVAGIILSAVSDELLIAHPDEPYPYPILAVAGPALYLLGHNLFRVSMARSISMNRLIATFALLALVPFSDTLTAVQSSAAALVILLALIVREETFTVAPLQAPTQEGATSP